MASLPPVPVRSILPTNATLTTSSSWPRSTARSFQVTLASGLAWAASGAGGWSFTFSCPGFSANAWSGIALTPATSRPATNSAARVTLTLVSNMVFITPSIIPATWAEIRPAVACPAATAVAALTVDATSGDGTQADAVARDRATATAPPVGVKPWRTNRLASIRRAVVNRPDNVPSGTRSCRAASLRVLPSRSQITTASRYLSGRRFNLSNKGRKSRQTSASSTASGSGMARTCFSLDRRFAALTSSVAR